MKTKIMDIDKPKTSIVIENILNVIKCQPANIQRLLNDEHVDYLVNDQIEEYKKNGMFSILQSITCGDLNNRRYILDGQHRIAAFKHLHNLNYPLNQNIPLIIYHINSLEELKYYYKRINKHHPINPLEISDTWFIYGKSFCIWLKTQFSAYIKNTEKTCNCPNINLREMMIYIKNRNVFSRLNDIMLNEDVSIVFQRSIVSINQYLINNFDVLRKLQFTNDFKRKIEKCYGKNEENPCFLGIWRQFEWIEIAIYLIKHNVRINEIDLSLFNNERIKIPKCIRNDVWKKRNGNVIEGFCFVCNNSLIFDNMECGHIIPHVCKGQITIDNLEPICKTCNRDMGIMNLNEYKSILNINKNE